MFTNMMGRVAGGGPDIVLNFHDSEMHLNSSSNYNHTFGWGDEDPSRIVVAAIGFYDQSYNYVDNVRFNNILMTEQVAFAHSWSGREFSVGIYTLEYPTDSGTPNLAVQMGNGSAGNCSMGLWYMYNSNGPTKYASTETVGSGQTVINVDVNVPAGGCIIGLGHHRDAPSDAGADFVGIAQDYYHPDNGEDDSFNGGSDVYAAAATPQSIDYDSRESTPPDVIMATMCAWAKN